MPTDSQQFEGSLKNKGIIIYWIGLLALVIAIYLPNLDSYFLAGDFTHLHYRNLSEVIRQFIEVRRDPELLLSEYRPLTELFYYMQIRLFYNQPIGYHLVSLLLHIISALLFYRVLQALTSDVRIAMLATLLWSLHPAIVDIVSWICVQGDQLCAIFYLLSLLYFIRFYRGQGIGQLLASLGFMLLSILSKEMGLTIPFMVAAYLLFTDPRNWGLKRLASIRFYISISPYFALFILYWVLRMEVFGGAGGYPLKLGAYILQNLYKYWEWFFSLGPIPAIIYEQALIHWILFIVPFILVLLLLPPTGFGLRLRYIHDTQTTNLVKFFYGWIFVALIPVYTIIKNTNNYIPLMGFISLVSIFMVRFFDSKRGSLRGALRVLAVFLCVLLAVHYFRLSAGRVRDFVEAATISQSIIEQSKQILPRRLPEGMQLGYIGLPNHHREVFVMGIGINGAIKLEYPGSNANARRLTVVQELEVFGFEPGKPTMFFQYKNCKLIKRDDLRDKFHNHELKVPQGLKYDHLAWDRAALEREFNRYKVDGDTAQLLTGLVHLLPGQGFPELGEPIDPAATLEFANRDSPIPASFEQLDVLTSSIQFPFLLLSSLKPQASSLNKRWLRFQDMMVPWSPIIVLESPELDLDPSGLKLVVNAKAISRANYGRFIVVWNTTDDEKWDTARMVSGRYKHDGRLYRLEISIGAHILGGFGGTVHRLRLIPSDKTDIVDIERLKILYAKPGEGSPNGAQTIRIEPAMQFTH